MAIDVDEFCALIESCIGAPYETPGSTDIKKIQNGAGVDCSGLLLAAAKELGLSLPHSSNSLWRKYLTDKGSISDHTSTNGYPKNVNPLKGSQLKKGMAVFKWSPTGCNNPAYEKDGQGNYQHVAVVTSVKPLRIVHASTETDTVKADTKGGRFCAWGYIKGVDYHNRTKDPENEPAKKEDYTMENATGRLKLNTTLNVRDGADVTCNKLGTLSKGTETDFIGVPANGWVQIEYKGKQGWIATMNGDRAYITVVEVYGLEDEDELHKEDEDDDDGEFTLSDRVDELEDANRVQTEQISEIVKILKKAGYNVSNIPGMRL